MTGEGRTPPPLGSTSSASPPEGRPMNRSAPASTPRRVDAARHPRAFCPECIHDDQRMPCRAKRTQLAWSLGNKEDGDRSSIEALEKAAEALLLERGECLDANAGGEEDVWADFDAAHAADEGDDAADFCAGCPWEGERSVSLKGGATAMTCGHELDSLIRVYGVPKEIALRKVLSSGRCAGPGERLRSTDGDFGSAGKVHSPAMVLVLCVCMLGGLVVALRRREVGDRRRLALITVAAVGLAGLAGLGIYGGGLAEASAATPSDGGDSSVDRSDDMLHFRLCNRTVYIKDMPSSSYGSSGGADPTLPPWPPPRNTTARPSRGILVEHGKRYGRLGNWIAEFLNGLDMARERRAPLVLNARGFPMDEPLNQLFLGLKRDKLRELFGISFYEGDEPPDAGHGLRHTRPMELMQFGTSNMSSLPLADRADYRDYVIQQLYILTARHMEMFPESSGVEALCRSFPDEGGAIRSRRKGGVANITERFTVVHSRNLEGTGVKALRAAHEAYGVDPRVNIDYPSQFLKDVLGPLGLANESIVMITDGQNRNVTDRLLDDSTIDFHVSEGTAISDLMLGVLSTVFIGNPVSTFTTYIAAARYALGLGPTYLHARYDEERRVWTTFCDDEECFYRLHR